MSQRKHTEIIAERASKFSEFVGCNAAEQQVALRHASQVYQTLRNGYPCSGAYAITAGFKQANRMRVYRKKEHAPHRKAFLGLIHP